ncbi:V-type ATP synthase subunit A [Candidatus Woesearchaeota archaeon CG_4_10_14_0_2_um_filter_57_5]|nr:MAG: V-type ATP synthase subunit A [Candidatus Woesearchaeota archaeon CG_4_10_14_0_2_um_filter_57_5]
MSKGTLKRIAGPVVEARGVAARMFDIVRVGKERLMGEVIQIHPDYVTIQVYEDTSALQPGEPVENTGQSLSVELGPGLLTSIYDGIQRPLPVLRDQMGDFILRGVDAPGLDAKKMWEFTPTVAKGDTISGGTVLGEVQETEGITHRVMAPPTTTGKVKDIKKGSFTVHDTICTLDDGTAIAMCQRWPVRRARPVKKKLPPLMPLITGQRIFDALFPLAKGGVAAIPGPFGAGKTVTQQTLAKWCDADIIVYVGCGERGNEMTDVLTEFPHLVDPRTNKPLMNRTVLIANTSNMPVAAREASIYVGVTIAEYFRDMGYHVALMADSTSRWAEAMREISSRLEEIPGEEGYPAYLSTRLAEFYERSGRVRPLGVEQEGSVTLIGAVSPPGGDFSEPVTQSTLRVAKTFWALDAKLAQRRHFPSINWLTSYSLYLNTLEPYFAENVSADWRSLVDRFMTILQEEEKLLEIVQLVGSDSLPPKQQLTLEVARLIREFFLQQNAFHDVDTFCELKKSHQLMQVILHYADMANRALDQGKPVQEIIAMQAKDRIGEAKFEKNYKRLLDEVVAEIDKAFKEA